jgi:hypothetical protein
VPFERESGHEPIAPRYGNLLQGDGCAEEVRSCQELTHSKSLGIVVADNAHSMSPLNFVLQSDSA